MLSMEPAHTEQQFDELLEIIYHQTTTYLNPVLDLIELTWDQFGEYFRSTGTAFRICQEGKLVGLCWVEERQGVLMLLGLIVKPAYQRQGIGTLALDWLQNHCTREIAAIELQVHRSNPRAKALYERMGYREKIFDPDSGFYTLVRENTLSGVCLSSVQPS